MTASSQSYDVAVVGAGPSGSATATFLARAGLRIVLLDKATFPRHKPCAECVSPAATPILCDLGVLTELEQQPHGVRPGFRIHAANGISFQGDFAGTLGPDGQPIVTHGLNIPRYRLDAALLGAARNASVEVREGWRLASLTRDATSGTWQLTPSSGDPVHARLLVAADGVHSTVARRLNLHIPGRMRKIAMVAHMRGVASLTSHVELHIANRRYVGIAPLESPGLDMLCNVAMVVDEARDGAKLAGHPQAFLLESLASFPSLRDRVSALQVIRPALTVSRLTVRARRLSDDGLLLVGDAAGYFDPFTGEGIYHGLRTAQLAASVATSAIASGDLSAASLARYDHLVQVDMRGKRLIERIVQSGVQFPPVMDHLARTFARRKPMADTIVATTGDILPPSAVLRPSYLLRLLV